MLAVSWVEINCLLVWLKCTVLLRQIQGSLGFWYVRVPDVHGWHFICACETRNACSNSSDTAAVWVSKEVLIWAYHLSNNTAGSDKCRSPEKQNVCFLGSVLGIKKSFLDFLPFGQCLLSLLARGFCCSLRNDRVELPGSALTKIPEVEKRSNTLFSTTFLSLITSQEIILLSSFKS